MLNVTALDKAGGKSNQITITNDKGRLSKEEIEEMVANAEKYKSEDELVRKRVEAKNGLESYAYNVKNATTDEKLAGKFEEADKTALETKIAEVLQWLESNSEAQTEEFEAK